MENPTSTNKMLQDDTGRLATMVYFILDLETAPLELDEKTKEYLMEKATRREMHPVFSKIICIGIKRQDEKPRIYHGDNERETLEKFWNALGEIFTSDDLIVTFNGYGFDIPFLIVRSHINGIEPKIEFNTNKWRMDGSNHFDCMLALSYLGNFTHVALEICCRMLKISYPEDIIRGEEMVQCYTEGDWDPILYRNKQHLILTEELYKKIR